MSITVLWLGHASFKIVAADVNIYIDPWKLKDAPHDATLVLVSHSHYDHYSAEDFAKVAAADTMLIASADVVAQHGSGRALRSGDTLDFVGGQVTAVAAYNPNKQFHPQANNWVGFIVEIDGKRIYYAGDTDLTPEMQALTNIDLALLPVGGTYTMNAEEAADAVNEFKPAQALPYHWGDIVGENSDAEKFRNIALCQVTVLTPDQSMKL
ncbi:MBL fold metallo-hydrolase [Planctomycetota bacterium]